MTGMKVPIYVRVGRGRNGYKVDGSAKRTLWPLRETRDGQSVPIPTVEQVRLDKLGIAAEIVD